MPVPCPLLNPHAAPRAAVMLINDDESRKIFSRLPRRPARRRRGCREMTTKDDDSAPLLALDQARRLGMARDDRLTIRPSAGSGEAHPASGYRCLPLSTFVYRKGGRGRLLAAAGATSSGRWNRARMRLTGTARLHPRLLYLQREGAPGGPRSHFRATPAPAGSPPPFPRRRARAALAPRCAWR